MVNYPGFFKIYVPSLGKVNQKIPIQGTWPTYLTLRDRYNNLWRVKVEMVGDSCYFTDGWMRFIDDNKIVHGDIVVYQYSYEGLFDFKIFGGDACMTEGVGGYRPKIKSEGHQVTEVDDGVVGEEATHEEGQTNDSTPGIQVKDEGAASRSQPKRSKEFDWFGAVIFRSGVIRQPTNPYFVTKINKLRRCELYIPKKVIKLYQLQLPEKMSLFDPDGRDFPVTCKTWSDGRMIYRGGWGALCKMYSLGEEDICICEFVQGGQDLCIHVSFVRTEEQK